MRMNNEIQDIKLLSIYYYIFSKTPIVNPESVLKELIININTLSYIYINSNNIIPFQKFMTEKEGVKKELYILPDDIREEIDIIIIKNIKMLSIISLIQENLYIKNISSKNINKDISMLINTFFNTNKEIADFINNNKIIPNFQKKKGFEYLYNLPKKIKDIVINYVSKLKKEEVL